jgi:hypothetical protein
VRTVLRRRLVAITALVVIVGAIAALITINVVKGLPWSVNFSAVATFIVTVVLAAVVPVGRLVDRARGTLPLSDTTLAKAREDLAKALADGWAEEDRLRRINDPWPLPVRWEGPLAGQFDEIGQMYADLPHRRLVILGPAGAGKTALAIKLVRELLRQRHPGDPVPVLLPASTWIDPCPMTEWVGRQLALDHPGLDVQVRTGTGDVLPLARSLAASEVLPFIDGLDELPEDRRAQVIAEINAYGSDNAIVLTSRPQEYEQAAEARPVTLASVITLQPLAVADVRAYLNDATDAPLARWDPVFETLETDPDGPLAPALTNPLMLWLARTEYEHRDSVPAELTTLPDRDTVEGHLLAGFVPAVYATGRGRKGFRCSRTQAERWLSFLASRQDRAGTPDIVWWRLCQAEPGWVVLLMIARTVLYTCIGWWAVNWALIRSGYWRAGAPVWHGQFRDLLMLGPLGRSVRPLTDQAVSALGVGVEPNLNQSLDHFLQDVVSFGLGRTVLVTAGISAIVAIVGLIVSVDVPQTPRITGASIRSMASTWLFVAFLAFLVWASRAHREPIGMIASLWRTKLVLIWIGVLIAARFLNRLDVPVDVSSATEPAALLRRARWAYLLDRLALAASVATVWLWAGTTFAIAQAIGIVGGLVIVMVAGSALRGAWPRFHEARIRLALRRRLPWRTMAFLADAHQRGVLRQVGAAYQFRHIRLQEELAAGYSAWPPLLAPLAARLSGYLQVFRDFRVIRAAEVQNVRVSDGTVSGVIKNRTVDDALRDQLADDTIAIIVISALSVVLAMVSWKLTIAGFVVLVTALTASLAKRLRRYRAGRAVVPETWSFNVTAGRVLTSHNDVTDSFDVTDIVRVRIADVRAADGSTTEWTALCGLLSSGAETPLVWLTTKRMRLTTPGLKEAVDWLPADVLSAELAEVRAANATGYWEVGALQDPGAARVADPLIVVVLAIALFPLGQVGLGVVCVLAAIVMLLGCAYWAALHRVMQLLPTGYWSLSIAPRSIQATVNGVVTQLSRDDIEEAELRSLCRLDGRQTAFESVQLRTQDGWRPLYPSPIFDTSRIPTELLVALDDFAEQRLGKRLARLAKRRSEGD